MRDIRFRAWDSLHNDMSCSFTLGEDVVFPCIAHKEHTMAQECVHNNQFTIMQFTGLQDSQGVDIYESDIVIVKSADDPVEVIYSKRGTRFGGAGWKGHYITRAKYQKLWSLIGCKVIGNIYSNPELIK